MSDAEDWESMTILRTDNPCQHKEGDKSCCQKGEKGFQGKSSDHTLSALVFV